jgi:hypothetical protein
MSNVTDIFHQVKSNRSNKLLSTIYYLIAGVKITDISMVSST